MAYFPEPDLVEKCTLHDECYVPAAGDAHTYLLSANSVKGMFHASTLHGSGQSILLVVALHSQSCYGRTLHLRSDLYAGYDVLKVIIRETTG